METRRAETPRALAPMESNGRAQPAHLALVAFVCLLFGSPCVPVWGSVRLVWPRLFRVWRDHVADLIAYRAERERAYEKWLRSLEHWEVSRRARHAVRCAVNRLVRRTAWQCASFMHLLAFLCEPIRASIAHSAHRSCSRSPHRPRAVDDEVSVPRRAASARAREQGRALACATEARGTCRREGG